MRAPRSSFPFRERREALPGDGMPAPGAATAGYLALGIDANHNQRVVFQEIRTRRRVTRNDLAAVTGLTKPTVVNLSRQLLQAGLIIEAERASKGRGQPAWLLELNPDGAYSAGLNIDRDHLTLVMLDLSGAVRGRASAEIGFASPDQVAAFVRRAWPRVTVASGIPADRVMGLGIALPDELGTLAFPGKPAGYDVWARTEVATLLDRIYPGPTFIENDAVAAAIGEAQFGHGLDAPSFVYVLVSVLLGGGIVIDRHYFRGDTGRSGEIGFMRVTRGDGTECALQDVVSLGALTQWLGERGMTIDKLDDLDRLADAGAAALAAWLDEAAGYLADIFAQIGQFVDPDAILLGGRLPGPLLDRLATLCRDRLALRRTEPAIDIRRAKLSSDAPAIGAAILPFQHLLFPSRPTPGRF